MKRKLNFELWVIGLKHIKINLKLSFLFVRRKLNFEPWVKYVLQNKMSMKSHSPKELIDYLSKQTKMHIEINQWEVKSMSCNHDFGVLCKALRIGKGKIQLWLLYFTIQHWILLKFDSLSLYFWHIIIFHCTIFFQCFQFIWIILHQGLLDLNLKW